jgi:hypothetical protein
MDQVRADVYRRFAALWADSEPLRDAHELWAAMRAAGLSEEVVTDEWLRSLSSDWVYGRAEVPFTDERVNRIYRRELSGQ